MVRKGRNWMFSVLFDSRIFFRSVLEAQEKQIKEKHWQNWEISLLSSFFIKCSYHIYFKFKLRGATTDQKIKPQSKRKTYSPVENIPTVNTMQAHDKSCIKSIKWRKYANALPTYILSVICLLLPQNVQLQERKRCKKTTTKISIRYFRICNQRA